MDSNHHRSAYKAGALPAALRHREAQGRVELHPRPQVAAWAAGGSGGTRTLTASPAGHLSTVLRSRLRHASILDAHQGGGGGIRTHALVLRSDLATPPSTPARTQTWNLPLRKRALFQLSYEGSVAKALTCGQGPGSNR